MSGKAVTLFCGICALFVFIQAHGQIKGDHGKSAESRGSYVNVTGTEYYIETTSRVHRDEAKVECEARNMSLISFQTLKKFEDTVNWLFDYGYDTYWFWTGALKEVNSSVWIWEPTGEEFTYFQWGWDQPTVNNDSIRTCIDFKVFSGWDDDDCEQYSLGYICE
ncbi:lectin subunit alpha-like [Neocloeon triangulifer]|uniref:lectin subunit alpha-like n=1 Tax=Neocloeon triangulifer TaxID=2078957 RepID=UPI00286F7057|nr:lectin subunit alpha-like [Neocloeon triangulifer]